MGGKTKRKLTDWNRFVMKVKVENPEKAFGDVLKLAGKMKRQGVKIGDYVKNKTRKVVKKLNKSMKRVNKKVYKKNKSNKRKSKGRK